jgi:hypothetical protein
MRTARRDVDVVVTRPIAAPACAVLDVLHDLEFIAEFEPEVASASVHPTTRTRAYVQRTMKVELSAIDVLARGVLARPQLVRQR